jgi:hypothetical protein
LLLDWPKDKIANFKSAIKSENFQIEFPYWLAHEVKRKNISYPNQMNYITPYFYELVEAAKPEWFKEFKLQLTYKSTVNSFDIKKATGLKISDSRIREELFKESEEREFRKIIPHAIARPVVEEGKTQYVSNINKQEIDDVEEADVPGFRI